MTEAVLDDAPHPRASPEPGAPNRVRRFLREHRLLLPWLAVGLAGVAVGVFFLMRYFASFVSTDDAQVDGNISAIGARVAGTVVAVHVENDRRVKPGDPLVELDPEDYRVAVELAEANLEHSRFELAQAKANSGIVQVDLARARRLLATGATTGEDVDTRSATAAARTADSPRPRLP